MHSADDAARAVLNLIRGIGGEHVGTAGGRRRSKRSGVKTRSKSFDSSGSDPDEDNAGGNDGDGVDDNNNPMTAEWDMIRGGIAGAPVRLPIGAEGTVLAVVDGQLAWVYLTELGAPVAYITFMDGLTEYDVTDASDVPLWA